MKRHLSYANIAATLALVFSMTGVGLAASHYVITSRSQIKPTVLRSLEVPGPRGLAGLQGAPGPAGASGINGGEVNLSKLCGAIQTATIPVESAPLKRALEEIWRYGCNG